MSYIDYAYYNETFHGKTIPAVDFDRIADIASDLVYGICYVKPNATDEENDKYKKSVAYEVELLYEQGGVDAILGLSEASRTSGSESLGNYSVTSGCSGLDRMMSYNGIPVSPITLMLLDQLGLRCRWAYAERERRETNGES